MQLADDGGVEAHPDVAISGGATSHVAPDTLVTRHRSGTTHGAAEPLAARPRTTMAQHGREGNDNRSTWSNKDVLFYFVNICVRNQLYDG
jgi:hypothetical protein